MGAASARLAYTLAFGLGAAVMVLFGLGLFAMLTPLAAWALLLGGLALLPLSLPLIHEAVVALRFRAGQMKSAHWGLWALVGLCAIQAVMHAVADLAPPLEGDTVTQYMLTARYWADAERYWQPDHVWASPLPGHLMMLSTWGILLRRPLGGSPLYGFSLASLLAGFLMSLFLPLAIYALARTHYGGRVGLVAAAILFLMPDATYLAESGKVDLGWAFSEALALASLLHWSLTPDPSQEPHPRPFSILEGGARGEVSWLIVGGAMTGLALGSKSQAVLSLPFLAGWIAVIAWRRGGAVGTLRALAAYFSVALVVGSPYPIYNAVAHHNPLYPVFADASARWFGGTPSVRSELGTEVFYAWTPGGYLRNLWDASLGHPPPFYLGFWAGPAFLMILPLGLLLNRRDPVARGLLLYAFLFSIAWFLVKQAVRHFLPGLALLAVVSGTILVRLDGVPRWLRSTVYAALNLSLALGVAFWAGINRTNGTPLAALGLLTPEEYIARWTDQVVNDPTFPDSEIVAYVNTRLDPGARMVNFHANNALYFWPDQITSTLREPVDGWESENEADLLMTFERYHADYLLVWKADLESIPDPADRRLILRPEFYERHGELMIETPRTYLYQIGH